jgi:hypothetical protein
MVQITDISEQSAASSGKNKKVANSYYIQAM